MDLEALQSVEPLTFGCRLKKGKKSPSARPDRFGLSWHIDPLKDQELGRHCWKTELIRHFATDRFASSKAATDVVYEYRINPAVCLRSIRYAEGSFSFLIIIVPLCIGA